MRIESIPRCWKKPSIELKSRRKSSEIWTGVALLNGSLSGCEYNVIYVNCLLVCELEPSIPTASKSE
jgi:hypothetical protein